MNRKLVKQAGQALTITLPIDWIRENGLHAGDEISIEAESSNLIVKSSNKVVTGAASINLNKIPKRLKYALLNSAYAKGVDELELLDDNDDFYPGLGQNIGYVIVDQRKGRLLIKDVSGTSTENLDEIFKRVFQMTVNYYGTAITHMSENKLKDVKQIYEYDREINKFALFLQRAIVKQAYANREVGKIMFAYSFALEQIGDEITRIWREFSEDSPIVSSGLLELLEMSRDCLQTAFEVYYHSGFKKMDSLVRKKQKVRGFAKTMKSPSMIAFRSVKIVEQSSDLIQLAAMLKLNVSNSSEQ